MTITESIKDTNDEGIASYRKHKIYLYKEDFNNFEQAFKEVSKYIISEKGEEIISNKKIENIKETKITSETKKSATDFTEVNFDELGKD